METYFNVSADTINNSNFDINETNMECYLIKHNIPVNDYLFIKENQDNVYDNSIFIKDSYENTEEDIRFDIFNTEDTAFEIFENNELNISI